MAFNSLAVRIMISCSVSLQSNNRRCTVLFRAHNQRKPLLVWMQNWKNILNSFKKPDGTKVPSLSVLVEIANTLSVSADELLLDCLEHSSSSANSEFHRLLLDCNETEQTVIIRMAKELKAALVSLGI